MNGKYWGSSVPLADMYSKPMNLTERTRDSVMLNCKKKLKRHGDSSAKVTSALNSSTLNHMESEWPDEVRTARMEDAHSDEYAVVLGGQQWLSMRKENSKDGPERVATWINPVVGDAHYQLTLKWATQIDSRSDEGRRHWVAFECATDAMLMNILQESSANGCTTGILTCWRECANLLFTSDGHPNYHVQSVSAAIVENIISDRDFAAYKERCLCPKWRGGSEGGLDEPLNAPPNGCHANDGHHELGIALVKDSEPTTTKQVALSAAYIAFETSEFVMAQDELAVSKNYHHLTGRERKGYAGSHFAVLEYLIKNRAKHAQRPLTERSMRDSATIGTSRFAHAVGDRARGFRQPVTLPAPWQDDPRSMHSIHTQYTAQALQFERSAQTRAEATVSVPDTGDVATGTGKKAKGTKVVITEDLVRIDNILDLNTLYYQVTGHVCARRKGKSGEIALMDRIRQDIADARAAGAADEVQEDQ